MGWIGPAIAAAGQIGSAAMASNSAGGANKTNIKLQQRQQAYETFMSNTAVQRRAADIEAAGGNRALAFTGGQSASTPSVPAAHVEPRYKGEGGGALTEAMLVKAQLDNIRANTAQQVANARITNVEADIREGIKSAETSYRNNHFVEAYEWDDLKTKITRSLDASSAAEAKRNSETVDALIAKAVQDAKAGQLNLEALQNIAKIGGIEAGKMQGVIKMIIDLMKD